jgi:glycosyltransferase involved in cell wall biosynthesis
VLDGYFSRPVQRTFISFERSLAKRTDVLIAVSDEIRDELLGLGIGRPDQWHVIALGFDLGDLLQVEVARGTLRARIGVSADAPLVGALGRLAPIKAYDMLIRAVARLPDVHLALLGDGPLKPELEALAISLGVSERVHLPGWWTNVPAAMSDLDVVALSSLNEGTPVSLIEAAAAARPVVATRVGGVSSVVVDGVTGYLVPPNDPAALAQSMGELLRDPALRRRMGAAARSRAVTLYDKDRLVADIQDLYLGLLRGGKRGLD